MAIDALKKRFSWIDGGLDRQSVRGLLYVGMCGLFIHNAGFQDMLKALDNGDKYDNRYIEITNYLKEAEKKGDIEKCNIHIYYDKSQWKYSRFQLIPFSEDSIIGLAYYTFFPEEGPGVWKHVPVKEPHHLCIKSEHYFYSKK